MLNALRLHRGGHLLPFTFCLSWCPRRHGRRTRAEADPQCAHDGYRRGTTRPALALPAMRLVFLQSAIQNPKSRIQTRAAGSRTRLSDWGSNPRFGPVEDRRNNRRLATFSCTLCVLQIWWTSPFTSPPRPGPGQRGACGRGLIRRSSKVRPSPRAPWPADSRFPLTPRTPGEAVDWASRLQV